MKHGSLIRLLVAFVLCLFLMAPTAGAGTVEWGTNVRAQGGAGYESVFSPLPATVTVVSGVRQIAPSYHFSLAVMYDGTVKAWGGNIAGELGQGTRSRGSVFPVTVKRLSNVTQVADGGAHAIALLSNGEVETWGGNTFGQLGNGTSGHGLEGFGSPLPVKLGLTNVVQVAASGGDDAVLFANGTVDEWGENKDGQIGDGTTVEKDVPTPVAGVTGATSVSVGGITSLGGHTLILRANGQVLAVGENTQGQLGDGTTIQRHTVVLSKVSNATAVSADVSHSMALLTNRTVQTWGAGEYGQLGYRAVNSTVPRTVPGLTEVTGISAGFRYSLATNGVAWGWGWNHWATLGNGTLVDRTAPAQIPGITGVLKVVAGEYSAGAILEQEGPPPATWSSTGRGSVTIYWRSNEAAPWNVSLRTPSTQFGHAVTLAGTARSYTYSGLASNQTVEVQVRNSAGFRSHIVTATPQ